jgi:preprotein translocase subunit SecA
VTIATNMAGRGTDITCGSASLADAVRHWIAHGLLPRTCSVEPDDDLWGVILSGWAERWAPDQVGAGMTPANLLLAINRQRAAGGLPALPEPSRFRTGVDVRALGGLCVIGSERHESRRIDRQLCGRSGRQGDPGMTRFVLALDDELVKRFVPELSARLARTPGTGALSGRDLAVAIREIARAQQRAEEFYSNQRKHLLGYDLVTNTQRQRIYTQRQALLDGSDVHATVTACFHQAVDHLVQDAAADDCRGLELARRIAANIVREYDGPHLDPSKIPVWQNGNACVAQIRPLIDQELAQRQAQVGESYPAFLRAVTLQSLDHHWMQHLNALDHVRHGIGLEGYAQQDPHLRYKQEAFKLYGQMQIAIAHGVARMALRHPQVESQMARIAGDSR